jgi:hypothetical protein
MKITKSQLKQVIKEELESVLKESDSRRPPVQRAEIPKFIREKPLPDMDASLSLKLFAHQIQAGVFGRLRSMEEIEKAYNKLYSILDVDDRSHLEEARSALEFEKLLNTFLDYQEQYEGTSTEDMAMGLKNAWSRMSDKVVGPHPPTASIEDPPPPREKQPRDWLALFEKDELRQIIKQTLQEVI